MNDYKIKLLYEKMEMEIISSMKRNYQRHLNEEAKTGFKYTQWQAEKLKELKRYQRENQDIIGKYTNNLSEEISKQLQEELRQGSINAIKQYNKILKQDLKPDKIMNRSFFKTNDRKINSLIKSVNNDLKTANTAVLRMANDQYRQVIHKSAFFVGNGVFTEQQAAKMATKELTELQLTKLAIDESNKDFLSRGLNSIEYADGRRVNIASYSQMAVRTANLRAQLMGEGDFRKSIGRHLVQATSHGGACPICQKWEGRIFIDDVYSGGTSKDGNYMLLSTAMKQGFLHPNCRHGLTTYYPELEGIENETEEEYQADMDYINQKINYIERNIKRYDRLKTGSIDTSNIKYYSNKETQWKNEMLIYDDPFLSTSVKNYSKSVYSQYEKNTFENLGVINPKNNKKIGKIHNTQSVYSVSFSDKQLSLMKDYHRELYAIHNHPYNHTFSFGDIKELFDNDSLSGIIVSTEEFNYYLIPKVNDLDLTKRNLNEFMDWLEKISGIKNDELLPKFPNYSNNEIQHLVFKDIFGKLGWKYGRERK